MGYFKNPFSSVCEELVVVVVSITGRILHWMEASWTSAILRPTPDRSVSEVCTALSVIPLSVTLMEMTLMFLNSLDKLARGFNFSSSSIISLLSLLARAFCNLLASKMLICLADEAIERESAFEVYLSMDEMLPRNIFGFKNLLFLNRLFLCK